MKELATILNHLGSKTEGIKHGSSAIHHIATGSYL